MSLAASTETTEKTAEPLDFWTPEGLRVFGELIKHARTLLGADPKRPLSQRKLSVFLQQRTGCFVSDRTIGNVENAQVEPNHNTVAIFAAAEFLRHPFTNQLLSRQDINEVVCGRYNPYENTHKSRRSTVTFLSKPHLEKGHRGVTNDGYGFGLFIKNWCQRQSPPLSETDFFRLIETAIQDYGEHLDLAHLRQVYYDQQQPSEEEVGFLGTILRDDAGLPYDFDVLLEIAGIRNGDTSPANHVDG